MELVAPKHLTGLWAEYVEALETIAAASILGDVEITQASPRSPGTPPCG